MSTELSSCHARRLSRAACAALVATLAAGCTTGGLTDSAATPEPGSAGQVGDAYYLGSCAECMGQLGTRGETTEAEVRGRRLRFCSGDCKRAFDRSPQASLNRLDLAMIRDQAPYYPDRRSIVTGQPLVGEGIEFIVGNRLFRVASPAEAAQVTANPGPFLRALDEAVVVAQRPTYGMPAKCPVQGDILESDEPIDIVVANRMIRVCCLRCVRVVRARPSQFLAMVEYANRHPVVRNEP